MAESHFWKQLASEEGEGAIVLRRPVRDSGELDITPMIDITFLLLIFFLVATVLDTQKGVELPGARYGKTVSEHTSVIFCVFGHAGKGTAEVYVGNGRSGRRLSNDPKTRREEVIEEIKKGVEDGRTNVLVKAEKDVKHHVVSQISDAVRDVPDVEGLYLAVMEID